MFAKRNQKVLLKRIEKAKETSEVECHMATEVKLSPKTCSASPLSNIDAVTKEDFSNEFSNFQDSRDSNLQNNLKENSFDQKTECNEGFVCNTKTNTTVDEINKTEKIETFLKYDKEANEHNNFTESKLNCSLGAQKKFDIIDSVAKDSPAEKLIEDVPCTTDPSIIDNMSMIFNPISDSKTSAFENIPSKIEASEVESDKSKRLSEPSSTYRVENINGKYNQSNDLVSENKASTDEESTIDNLQKSDNSNNSNISGHDTLKHDIDFTLASQCLTKKREMEKDSNYDLSNNSWNLETELEHESHVGNLKTDSNIESRNKAYEQVDTNLYKLKYVDDENNEASTQDSKPYATTEVTAVNQYINKGHFLSESSIEVNNSESLEKSQEILSLSSDTILDTNFRKLSSSIANEQIEKEKKKRQWTRMERKQECIENTVLIVSATILKDIIPDIKPYLEELEDELDHEHETDEQEVNKGAECSIKENRSENCMIDSDMCPAKPKSKESVLRSSDHTFKKEFKHRINTEKTCVIEIKNLVRPFQITRFKILLKKFGNIRNIDNGGFWIDKVKSHAMIEYQSFEEAEAALNALDDMKWPDTSPKRLSVSYSNTNALEQAICESDSYDQNDSKKESNRSMDCESPFRKRKNSDVARSLKAKIRGHSESPDRSSPDNERSLIRSKTNSRKPKKNLDEIFKKTKAIPCIYWQPRQ